MAKDMTQGRPGKIMIAFALSILASSLLDYVYGITDSAMLSYYVDKHALGATSSIIPALQLIQGIIFGFFSGFSITISRSFGANNGEKTKKVLANSIFIALMILLPSVIISFLLVNPITAVLNVPDAFMSDAVTYFTIIILALPISGASAFCSGLFRAIGDSHTPLFVSAGCGVLNVLFNYLFLAVIPMGVAGAAIGTVAASAVGTVVYIVLLIRFVPESRVRLSDMRPRSSAVKELMSDGLAIAMLNFVVNIGQVFIQRAINNFEPAVITGVSVGSKIVFFLWIVALAMESSLIYFCSQNVGAGRFDRIKEGIRSNLIISAIGGALCTAVMLIFREPLIRIFLGNGIDPETTLTLSYASSLMVTQLAFLPVIVLMTCLRGTVRGLGSAIPTVACGIIELAVRAAVMAICEFSTLADSVKINILFYSGPAAWVGAVVLLGAVLPITLKRKQEFLKG